MHALPSILRAALLIACCGLSRAAVPFPGEFAPCPPSLSGAEREYRDEVFLNGRWDFQPMDVPAGFVEGNGEAPALADPSPADWERPPIKIPSPWNVNAWGAGRDVGKGSPHPYWPDSVYFPSYPPEWEKARMGWLRRIFPRSERWDGKRVILHFEAVAGDCEVRLNGKVVARHFDSWLPFEVDVTDRIQDDNELLVGVRARSLFSKRSTVYPKMTAPYPTGSETEKLAGIWQDVSLRIVPKLRVKDVFVKPFVSAGQLEIEATVTNDTRTTAMALVHGEIAPWQSGTDDAAAGTYGETVLRMPDAPVQLEPGATATITRRIEVNGALKEWNPDSPNLYGLHLSIGQRGGTRDLTTTRFGWRRFEIDGRDLLLNGRKIQLAGDLLHPFGPFILSRSYVRAWYRMIKDFGGNAVRPHAQIHPRHFLDLADEMGLVVLDETSLFGSSIALNFEEPAAWTRFEEHLDGLVLRDRNHPSVLGWSFGNELFAIFHLNNVPEEQAAKWYGKLAALGKRTRELDPTRDWISCDGDQDLRGALPVWSAHFGHGTPLDRLPDLDKPLMVGESGGSYYARPGQLAEFNGGRAYQNYAGRNEALAIDVYDNITKMARPRLAYFSASETAWFGLEHLNYGYHDFSRLPTPDDGIRLTRTYQDGKPGIQPERIPPYVATLNPGWDPDLPPYKPLAMFDAVKAALARPQPAASPWDHRAAADGKATPPPAAPPVSQVAFIGDENSPLARRLRDLGIPLASTDGGFSILDGTKSQTEALENLKTRGGTAWLMLADSGDALPAGLVLTDRTATQLATADAHPWTADMAEKDLYFAEDGADRNILRHGIGGTLPEGAKVLLKAGAMDWSLFNEAPEVAKCAAAVLYEHLEKPAGAALVEIPWGKGRLVISSIDYRIESGTADAFWRRLLANTGIRLGEPANRGVAAFDREGVLVNAVAAGHFKSDDTGSAMNKDFVGEATVSPKPGMKSGDHVWSAVTSPSHDRFQLADLPGNTAEDGVDTAYFSFWIHSPRALDDLLLAGPDAPKFRLHAYVSDDCHLLVNGAVFPATRTEMADYRKLLTFDGIPLKKGWNRILIKVATDSLKGAEPGTLAVRMGASQQEFLNQIKTTVELKDR